MRRRHREVKALDGVSFNGIISISFALSDGLSRGFDTFGATLRAGDFDRPSFRRFFTFVVPLAAASYLPGLALLDKPDPLGAPVLVEWLAPLSGPLFLFVALSLFRLGVQRYSSTGS